MWGQLQLEVLIIFLIVYSLIIVRKVGRFKIEVWMAMLLGAAALLALGTVSFGEAISAINMNVVLFLFGAFLIVEIMIQTGLLQFLAVKFIGMARTPSRLLLVVVIFVGTASAFLVNDAVVLVMTPIVIAACTITKLKKMPYLLAVALSSNIGSALTPIGNPQNVLIKLESGINTIYFVGWMIAPVIISLAVEFLILRLVYRRDLSGTFGGEMPEARKMLTSKWGSRSIGAIAVVVVLGFLTSDLTSWPIALTAVVGGTAALLVSSDRRKAIKGIDWGTLVFFVSMFVVMDVVGSSGLLQVLIAPFNSTLFAQGPTSVFSIFSLSIVLSQVTSNVPFVALMLPVFKTAGASSIQWLALAAGSTLAGNLTLLGAAANVIVLEAAESRGESFSFAEFLKVGLPIALVTAAITAAFLSMAV